MVQFFTYFFSAQGERGVQGDRGPVGPTVSLTHFESSISIRKLCQFMLICNYCHCL